jgi:uncharacterized protein (DUF58 family)
MASVASTLFSGWTQTPKREASAREQAEHLGARLPPLMIQAERVASTVATGEHGRRRVGQGEAFWQFRRYRQEDPSTAVDWRQSAKSPHLFVREREWAAAASVWIWRDASPSMHYKSHVAKCTKVEPPATGKPGFNRFALQMTQQMTSKQSLPPLLPLPRFSQVILISDWLSPSEGVLNILRHYGALGVRGHLIQVLDPAEEDLPFDGRTEFEDVESKTRMLARRAETLRDAYRGRLAALRSEVAQACRRQDWTFATHRTDKPAQGALLAAYAALSAHRPFEMR